jgi:3-phosphoshikimate 1-carboxyvinyltransferase
VPGDFSSAAFPIAAALITNSTLTIGNIDFRDCQGDKELISVFQQMGASITIDVDNSTLQVKNHFSPLKGILIDINSMIDALPILAVVACFAESETVIRNAAIARHKECNRLSSIAIELHKMGASISETEDGLIIRPSRLVGTTVFSHNDHRIAMALTCAALGATGQTTILDVHCISKTFPSFLHDFTAINARIEEIS